MNNYFTGITSHLNLKPDQINHSENLTNIIENLKNHESIQRIKLSNFHHRQTFNFRYVSVLEVKKELMNLSSEKATRKGDIPAKILKDSLIVYTKELTMCHLASKTMMIQTRKAIDLSAYSHICQRFLKESSINKSIVL